MTALSGQQFSIAAGDHTVTVAEVGAGLRSYRVGDAEITNTYGEDELAPKCCGVTLVPWPNRVRGGAYSFDGTDHQLALTEPAAGNAIHGLGRWARWTPVAQDADRITLQLDVVPQNGYPFAVQAQVTYLLHAERGMSTTLSARNVGERRVPFGAGSHPYLSTRGHALDEVTLSLPARTRLLVDEAQIPVGTSPVEGTDYDFGAGRLLGAARFDDGFTDLSTVGGRGSAEVRTPSGGTRLWFDEAFGYLQVFTRADLTPGRHGIAIEPMTCAPDAFNSGDGLIVLGPGERWSATWGIVALP